MGVYADAEIDLQETHLLEELAFRLRLTEDDLISSKANLVVCQVLIYGLSGSEF